MNPRHIRPIPPRFLFYAACAFEGALVPLALVLGALLEAPPFAHVQLRPEAVGYGVLGTLPLLMLFQRGTRSTHGALARIRRFLLATLGRMLESCSHAELLALATLAGLGEEAVFRGVLQPWAELHWGTAGGLILSNMLFGLAHAVTPLYAALAAATGLWLGLLMDMGEGRNLLTPIITHSLYDYVAFLALRRIYCASRG